MTVCPNQTSMGYQYDGGFAEYMIVPQAVLAVDGLNRIPEGLSLRRGVLVTEPLACASTGRNWPASGPGDAVVVIGRRPDRLPARAPRPGPRCRTG